MVQFNRLPPTPVALWVRLCVIQMCVFPSQTSVIGSPHNVLASCIHMCSSEIDVYMQDMAEIQMFAKQ